MKEIPFVGGSYTGHSRDLNSQEAINLFTTMDQSGKNITSMFNTPGLTEFSTRHTEILEFSIKEVRGMHVDDKNNLYAVITNGFYKVTSTEETLLGLLNTSYGKVWISHNETQIMIVDGLYGYTYEDTTGASSTYWNEVTDVDFSGATALTFQDGYFVFFKPRSDRIYISALNDGTSYDGTDFVKSTGNTDYGVIAISDHKEIWAFNTLSTEVYYNSGNADFPFDLVPGAFIETGCAAAGSVAKVDNSVFWLTNYGTVVRADGYHPVIISSRQLEYQIAQYGKTYDISDATAYTMVFEGNAFYVLTFPSVDITWVFNVVTGLWHKWASYPNNGRHRSNCYVKYGNKHLVGDFENGKIYELDSSVYTDDSELIRRVRTAKVIHEKREWIGFNDIEIEFEAGVGLVSGYGSDPQAMLRWSDDGSKTWSNEHWRSIGKIGEYSTRTRWRRAGRSRERVFELVVTDPVKVVILGAYYK